MKRLLTVGLAMLLAPAFLAGQDRAAETEILRIASDWDEAWNRGDVPGIAALLSEDVDFVSRSGFHVVGREGWTQALGAAFEGRYRDSERSTTRTHVTFVSPDMALLRVFWTISYRAGDDGSEPAPEHGTLLLVVARRDAGWIVVAGQNTNVPAPG